MRTILVLSVVLCLQVATAADTNVPQRVPVTSAVFPPADKSAISNAFWNSPELYNAAFGLLRERLFENQQTNNSYFRFVNDLNINFKVFDAGAAGEGGALGFDYNFEKALVGRTVGETSSNPLGMSLTVHARGNVAFQQEKNPDDFLDTGAKFHFFQSLGGWEPEMYATNKIAANELAQKLKLNLTPEEKAKDPDWQKWQTYLMDHALPQFFWDAAGNFSLESNQDFSQKQLAYGLQAGGVFRALDHAQWGRWNIFDYPFAAIRYVTYTDKKWRPSGTAFPLLLFAIDMVDPIDNDVRFAADPDEDPYPRFRAEVGFKTQLLQLSGKHYWLSMSYRYYQELGASAAIKQTKQDEFHYFAATLDLPANFNVSYSVGRLPLDQESDSVVALGWKLNF